MEQDQLGAERTQDQRALFERVWRRVMPEERPDCPIELDDGPERPARREEFSPPPAPADRRGREETEEAVPCLGRSSTGHGRQLQTMITAEANAAATYRSLAQRAGGSGARTLLAIAAEEQRHAKRLSGAYFLLSGVRYQPEGSSTLPRGATYLGSLRGRFAQEQRDAAAYLAAAEGTEDPCLRELFREIAADERGHARLIRELVE